MFNWLFKLFGYELIEVGSLSYLEDEIDRLNANIKEKSEKVTKFYKLRNDVSIEHKILKDHFNEIKLDLDRLTDNSKYMSQIIRNMDELKDLLGTHNIRTLMGVLAAVQNEILKESSRSNLTEQDVAYRAGAIDMIVAIAKKLESLTDMINKHEKNKTNKDDNELKWSD